MAKNVIVVSYYTPNYKAWARTLIQSLNKWGVQHDIREIDDKGGWLANVRYKPVFLRDMLKEHTEADAIVWIDADAIVKHKPILFKKIKADLAVYFLEWPAKEELLSGTVYLANNERVHGMMEAWLEALAVSDERLTKPEQLVLQGLLEKWKCIPERSYVKAVTVTQHIPKIPRIPITVHRLPKAYCQIEGTRGDDMNAVIVHGQASRIWRYKRKNKRDSNKAQKDAHVIIRRRRPPRPQKEGTKKPLVRRSRRRRRGLG